MGKGSTHIDTFMGLTSSGGVTVNGKLLARASSRPTLFQPRDHDAGRVATHQVGERSGGDDAAWCQYPNREDLLPFRAG
jgi:hypothetical protein